MPSALHSSCLAHRVLVSACCCLLTPRLTCHGTALPLMATWPCRDSLADCFAATGATCWCRCSGASVNLPTPPFPLCTRSIYPVPFHALTACCCCASTPYGPCLTQEKRLDQGRGPGLLVCPFSRVCRALSHALFAPLGNSWLFAGATIATCARYCATVLCPWSTATADSISSSHHGSPATPPRYDANVAMVRYCRLPPWFVGGVASWARIAFQMKTLPARLGQQSHQLSVRAAHVPPLHAIIAHRSHCSVCLPWVRLRFPFDACRHCRAAHVDAFAASH